ncbi:CBS domain protein, partial [gut metagenome]
ALLENTQVKDLVRKDFMPAVNINVSLDELLETSFHQNYVPVVDDRNKFIGIVTRQSLLRHFGKSNAKTVNSSASIRQSMQKQSLNG